MKIIKLRFKNLNSLAGEWEIDFTNEEYISNGIFAITGLTGSGKTTILDAVCLALYGETPRIKSISKTSNEIMTRQTGECFAEIIYETISGSYRNHWSQIRSRKKQDGNLQSPRHEIVDVKTNKTLATKLRDVKILTETKTGMDFNQFTRSMLLAQGSFAAFLKAGADERSTILEQITGSEIYTNISKTTHEQDKIHKDKLDLLNAELSGIHRLDDDEKNDIESKLQENNESGKKLDSEYKKTLEKIKYLENIADLKENLIELNKKRKELETAKLEFENDSLCLENAKLAKELEVEYQNLLGERERLEKNNKSLNEYQIDKPNYETSFKEFESKLTQENKKLNETKNQQEKDTEIIKEVRFLDAQITGLKSEQNKVKKTLNDNEKNQKNIKISIDSIIQEKSKVENQTIEFDKYLKDNIIDDNITEEFSGIEYNLKQFELLNKQKNEYQDSRKLRDKEIDQQKKDKKQAEEKVNDITKDIDKSTAKLDDISIKLKDLLKTKTIEQLQNEKDTAKEDCNILNNLLNIIKNITVNIAKISDFTEEINSLKINNNNSLKQVKKYLNQEKKLEEDIKLLTINLQLHNKIKDLEKERANLEDNKECPLCGSQKHPYAEGNIPQISDTEITLDEKEKIFADNAKKRTDLQLKRVKNESKLEHQIKIIRELKDEIEQDSTKKEKVLKVTSLNIKTELSIPIIGNKIKEKIQEVQLLSQKIEEGIKLKVEVDKKTANIAEKKDSKSNASESLIKIKTEFTHLQKESAELTKKLNNSTTNYENEKKQILITISKYNILETELKSTMQILKTKRDNWIEKKTQKENCVKQITDLTNDLNINESLLKNLNEMILKNQKEYDELSDELSKLEINRKNLYSNKNPDIEERKYKKIINNLEKSLNITRNDKEKANNALNIIKEQIVTFTKTIKKQTETIELTEQTFKENLKNKNFKNENKFKLTRLSDDEFQKLNNKSENLQNSQTALNAKLKDNHNKLKLQLDKKLTSDDINNLRTSQIKLDEELKNVRELIGGLKKELKIDNENKLKQKNKLTDKKQQEKEYLRWHNLHSLIGSANGSKFCRFAQGLTFEVMIQHANKQLNKMSNRYLLVRDLEEPLDLNVIDDYQGGEIRSTKNLSGGESFIISLSLALGLSQMASDKIKVDSLFLDEGFGTLDEDSLSVALDTLSTLQQTGKLIGVISHIASLKERIRTQIEIISHNNGTSTMTGPGIIRF